MHERPVGKQHELRKLDDGHGVFLERLVRLQRTE
jgi:hypothetical protein